MEIVLKNSSELTHHDWESYVKSFNKVFNKGYGLDYFKNKYLKTIDDISYHAFLTDGECIVGSCTVIPYSYIINNYAVVRIGLVVDVFIVEECREDPLALYRMYKKLRKRLIEIDVKLIVAVPNDVAYPYWKKVVKWRDIGQLPYYILPIRLGNIVRKAPLSLNLSNKILIKILFFISRFTRSEESILPIRLDRSKDILTKQRYTNDHKLISKDKFFFSYRVVNENGISTCYLLDFYNSDTKKKSAKSLRAAARYILSNEKVDLLIFVGPLSFTQFLLFKLPKRIEPKHLYFTADVFSAESDFPSDIIFDIKNWDFGLFNYDVR